MEIEVDEEAKTVSLSIDGTFTCEALTQLLHDIGDARTRVAEDPESPPGTVLAQLDGRFWVHRLDTGGCLLSLRTDRFGWLGNALAPASRDRLIDLLRNTATPGDPEAVAGTSGGAVH